MPFPIDADTAFGDNKSIHLIASGCEMRDNIKV
jgi:hypothetical protein